MYTIWTTVLLFSLIFYLTFPSSAGGLRPLIGPRPSFFGAKPSSLAQPGSSKGMLQQVSGKPLPCTQSFRPSRIWPLWCQFALALAMVLNQLFSLFHHTTSPNVGTGSNFIMPPLQILDPGPICISYDTGAKSAVWTWVQPPQWTWSRLTILIWVRLG